MTPTSAPTPTKKPMSSWITAGVSLVVVGIILTPINVLTAVGIGCIIGGLSVIGSAWLRFSH